MGTSGGVRGIGAALVPRQHGAWAVLLSAFVTGTIAGGAFHVNGALALLAGVAGFAAQNALILYRKTAPANPARRIALWVAAAYGMIVLSSGAALVHRGGEFFLFLGAVASVVCFFILCAHAAGKQRDLPVALAGIWGLSLTAPLAEYAASGTPTPRTGWVWILTGLFFTGSVFHVRCVLKAKKTGGFAWRSFTPSIAYQAAVILLAVGLWMWQSAFWPLAALAVFSGLTRFAGCAGARPDAAGLTPRAAGMTELAGALWLLLGAALCFR